MTSQRRIAITGGTGKTGRAVCAALRARGATPVPLGRADFSLVGAVPNVSSVAEAIRGADALYLIAPNMHEDEPGYVDAVLRAATEAGVNRVVYHSVAAPGAVAMPHHAAKLVGEDLVRRSGLTWSVLQPCAYLDNLLPAIAAVAAGSRDSADPQSSGDAPRGIVVPYDLDATFGMVALADIAEVAARVLLEPGHDGATYELGGPEQVSVRALAATASAALGVPVECARISIDDWRAGPGAGLEDRERDWLCAMFEYYDANGLPAGGFVTQALLGRAPLGISDLLRS